MKEKKLENLRPEEQKEQNPAAVNELSDEALDDVAGGIAYINVPGGTPDLIIR